MDAIRVVCPHCQASYPVKASYAGRRGRCPKCSQTFVVPAAAEAAPQGSPPPVSRPSDTATAKPSPSPSVPKSPPSLPPKPVQKPGSAAGPKSAVRTAPPPAASAAGPKSDYDLSDDAETYAISGSAEAPRVEALAESSIPKLKLVGKIPRPCANRPAYDARLEAAMLRGLDQSVPPPGATAGHILSSLLLAVALVVLPMLYLALVAAMFAAGIWLGFFFIQMSGLRSIRLRALLLAAPIGICFAAASMLKPLFARRRDDGESYTRRFVDPVSEPLLWSFCIHVCDAVGSVRPDRIQVVPQATAAAVRMGWLRPQYELVLGLPLIGALTAEEFSGLLAHEVGHFRQGLGIGLSRLIHGVNTWFFTVVYQRDGWDDQISAWSEAGGLQTAIAMVANLGVMIGRGVLYVLGMLGLFLSYNLERQQEFNADRYWCRLAGGASFISGMRKVWYLEFAQQLSGQFLNACYQQRVLPDDLTRLHFGVVSCLGTDDIHKIDLARLSQKTRWFDTHPTDRERDDVARRENEPGVYHGRYPAAWLLKDFEGMCQRATVEVYTHSLGSEFSPGLLRPLETFVGQREEPPRDEAQRAEAQPGTRPPPPLPPRRRT